MALIDPATGKMIERLDLDVRPRRMRFSPDGDMLASAGETTVVLYDLRSHTVRTRLSGIRGGTGGVYVWRMPDIRLVDILTRFDVEVLALAFSPDSRLLAASGLDGSIRVWDVPGQQLVRTLPGHTDALQGVAFSPDGRHLACGITRTAVGGQIQLWDLAEGVLRHTALVEPALAALAFHPSGKPLVSATWRENSVNGRPGVQEWSPGTLEPAGFLHLDDEDWHFLVFAADGTCALARRTPPRLVVCAGRDRWRPQRVEVPELMLITGGIAVSSEKSLLAVAGSQ